MCCLITTTWARRVIGINSNPLNSHVPWELLCTNMVIIGDEAVSKTSLVQTFFLLRGWLLSQAIHDDIRSWFFSEGGSPNVERFRGLFLYMNGGQPIAKERAKVMTYPFWADAQYIVCVFNVGSRQSFQIISDGYSKFVKVIPQFQLKKCHVFW